MQRILDKLQAIALAIGRGFIGEWIAIEAVDGSDNYNEPPFDILELQNGSAKVFRASSDTDPIDYIVPMLVR